MNPASSAEQKYTLMGVPFTGVTEGKGLFLDDLVIANAKGSGMSGSADQIMIWVDKGTEWGYETWYLNANSEWVLLGQSGTHFADLHSDGLPAGTAYWFVSARNNNARAVTSSGAVESDVYVDKTIRCNAMNFIAYPYPIALKLNDSSMVEWTGSKGSGMSGSADKIMIWIDKGEGKGWNYEEWYFYSDRTWRLNGSSSTKFEDKHPNGIEVNKGFWYNAKAQTGKETFTVRFKSPLAVEE